MGRSTSWGSTRFWFTALFFNIFINKIFFISSRASNHAHDSAILNSDKSLSITINSLSYELNIWSKWFYNNFMVLNPDKCSFVLLGVKDELQTDLVCGKETIKSSNQGEV